MLPNVLMLAQQSLRTGYRVRRSQADGVSIRGPREILSLVKVKINHGKICTHRSAHCPVQTALRAMESFINIQGIDLHFKSLIVIKFNTPEINHNYKSFQSYLPSTRSTYCYTSSTCTHPTIQPSNHPSLFLIFTCRHTRHKRHMDMTQYNNVFFTIWR